jgi:hypothetical protein
MRGCDESPFPDQTLRDRGTSPVELVRPVGCLANEDDAGVGHDIEHEIEVGRGASNSAALSVTDRTTRELSSRSWRHPPGEQRANLVVADLIEVFVPRADGEERIWRRQHDDRVGDRPE